MATATVETDQQRAKRIDRDRRRIELAALLASFGILRQAKRHAIAAYRLGHDPAAAVYDTLTGNGRINGLGPHVADAMTAAHLAGRRRSVNETTRRTDIDRGILIGLLLLGDDEQTALTAEYERTAQKMIEPMAARVRDAVRQAIQSQRPQPTAKILRFSPEQAIAETLAKQGVSAPTLLMPVADYAVQRLYEAAVGIGFQDGSGAVLDSPAVSKTIVAIRYRTMRDNRVRPTHREMEGVTRPPDDPVWESWTAPCGFGCRCVNLPVYEGEPHEMTAVLPDVEPDRGWHGGEYYGPESGANLYSNF